MSNQQPSKKKPSNGYQKYSGLAFQLLAAIGIGILLGRWVDHKFSNEKPVFTIIFSLFFVIAYLVLLVRDLTRKR